MTGSPADRQTARVRLPFSNSDATIVSISSTGTLTNTKITVKNVIPVNNHSELEACVRFFSGCECVAIVLAFRSLSVLRGCRFCTLRIGVRFPKAAATRTVL